jgi:co-chaperonin GroES (HSP10)
MTLENTSGIKPENDLVVLQEIPVKTSINGIDLPDALVQQEQLAQTQAYFVAAGEKALELPRIARKVPGQLVLYGRYAGWRHMGEDGKWYKILRADDVIAELNEYVEQTTLRGRVPIKDKEVDNKPRLVV